MTLLYLNNTLLQADEASISIEDRGFRFGDGVFETIRVYGGVPYRLERHLARLEQGLAALDIVTDTGGLPGLCRALLDKNAVRDGILRIVVTRGVGSLGYLPAPQANATVAIVTQAMPPLPCEPFDLWLSSYEKISPRALPVQFKLCQGMGSSLARIEAQKHGCLEALQLNAAGHVCEGSSANIFWLKEGTLYTPSLACGALAGITREAVMQLSPYPVREGAYLLEELGKAEAVVLTNSVWEIVPVRSLRPQSLTWESGKLAQILLDALHDDIAKIAVPC